MILTIILAGFVLGLIMWIIGECEKAVMDQDEISRRKEGLN